MRVRLEPAVAATLFSGLWLSVRETDFIGWYREERIAGAVLTQRAGAPAPDALSRIRQRVRSGLCERLSSYAARRLQVRVLQLQPRLKS